MTAAVTTMLSAAALAAYRRRCHEALALYDRVQSRAWGRYLRAKAEARRVGDRSREYAAWEAYRRRMDAAQDVLDWRFAEASG